MRIPNSVLNSKRFSLDMGRAAQAITYLLIGAAATGAGAAFFLYQTNADRSALIAQAEEAKRQVAEAVTTGKAVTDEANRKLDAAAQEVAKAKARVAALEEEREWLAKAQTLTTSRLAQSWKEWLNYTHGFTTKLPPTVTEPKNDSTGLDAGWIVIRPYRNETIALETAYVVKDHVLIGAKSDTSWLFRVQSSGNITHLVYAYPNVRVTERTILDALSTLTFRDE